MWAGEPSCVDGGAAGRTRTDTPLGNRFLKPARLPIPPRPHASARTGVKECNPKCARILSQAKFNSWRFLGMPGNADSEVKPVSCVILRFLYGLRDLRLVVTM
jgi:hypothetical protein